jgi:Tfp pilus assembly protein PilX
LDGQRLHDHLDLRDDAVIARLRQEHGIALVMALAFCVALSTLVFGVTQYVTSNQRNASNSTNDTTARSYAEAALNSAYSRLFYAKSAAGQLAGLSPTKPSLLGCATSASQSDTSDCSSPTPLCVAFAGTCPSGTYTPTAGTASYYGFFAGNSPADGATFQGVAEDDDMWIIVATGYVANGRGGVTAKALKATVLVNGGGAGAIASVWNHVFITSPLAATPACNQSISGNGTLWTAPLYVIGNLCLNGNNDAIQETGGQKIDLQVGGRLVLQGSGSSASTVGDWTTNPVSPITSGVVVGNCSSSLTGTTSDCATNYKYKVASVGTFVPQNDPQLKDSQVYYDYTHFDPSPTYPCQSGTTPTAITTAQLDVNRTSGELAGTEFPGNSGSGVSGGVFDLTPSSSYACISQKGTSTGYLIWNNDPATSLTVGGITVPAKTLAINGSIYIDAPLTISQSLTYKGTAIIMVSGQITITGNNQTICAQNTSCNFDNWQGSTGNNDMLTLATVLKNSSAAFNFVGQGETFMGSMWTQTSSQINFAGNTYVIMGPLSTGSMAINKNGFTFRPLPVITNMPLGAPVPPNVSVTINPMKVIG